MSYDRAPSIGGELSTMTSGVWRPMWIIYLPFLSSSLVPVEKVNKSISDVSLCVLRSAKGSREAPCEKYDKQVDSDDLVVCVP